MAATLSPQISSLIVAARSGDRASMELLLAAAQPDIRRFARKSCRHANDIDDAVQDAMWSVNRHVATLLNIAAFPAWLMMVVTRACWRLARRAIGGEQLEPLENDLRLSERPEADLRLDLAAAIQSLPEHYRDILLLRDIEERTINEIACLRDLTRETVKARLHRARALVREYLKE